MLDVATAGTLPPEAVFARVGSSAAGLSGAEAVERLHAFGPNALRVTRVSAWKVLARQLRSPLLVLLLAAALVSGLTGDPFGAVIIACIVVLSVGLGFFNEYRAAKAVAALHSEIRHQAVVWRDGAERRSDDPCRARRHRRAPHR